LVWRKDRQTPQNALLVSFENQFFCAHLRFSYDKDFTTLNSLPRPSITLTAMRRLSPGAKGSLLVPAKCAQTLSSNSPLSDFCRLSHAPGF
jgi:hypothetical protein